MGDIVWLASYPKSGNTWLRVFLTNYRRDTKGPADINRLDGGPIASARLWFDEWAGVEASSLPDAVIERLRPGVYRCLARSTSERLFLKVHDAWTRTDRGEALFAAEVTAAVVYVVRNPLDVAASWSHHYGKTIAAAVADICDPQLTLARSHGGLADQLGQRLGSWSGHVTSWLDESGLDVHVVRYEDLRQDPATAFSGVVRFCGLPEARDRLDRAVAFSDLGEMQRQEKERDFAERQQRSTAAFFRRGLVGGWRDELPADLARRIVDVHGETMRRFGYLDVSLAEQTGAAAPPSPGVSR